ncbi:MAG: helix-turn-helix transcriptional regulator [Ezakiella sp.]|nr:helix-turn-helix transcriptional regulator [Ezakiella sp.]
MRTSKLRHMRETRGMTQREVADAIGVGQVIYFRYENGQRAVPYSAAKKLSKLYDVPLEDIFLPKMMTNRYF